MIASVDSPIAMIIPTIADTIRHQPWMLVVRLVLELIWASSIG
jgi:hypothetical protein